MRNNSINIVIVLIFLSGLAYMGANLFYGFATLQNQNFFLPAVPAPANPTKSPASDVGDRNLRSLVSKNMFGLAQHAAAPSSTVASKKQNDLSFSDAVLVGVITGDKNTARAIIELKSKKEQRLYRIGQYIEGAVLVEIDWNHVVFDNNGNRVILSLSKDRSTTGIASLISQPADTTDEEQTTFKIDKREIQDALRHAPKILSSLHMRPYVHQGETIGYVITRIGKGSLPDRFGLHNGDIVQAVNSQAISGFDPASLYNRFKNEKELEVRIIRRGQLRTMRYLLEQDSP